MRVIKYGPGYEPKTHKCIWCNSEIEYTKDDIKSQTFYDDLCGYQHEYWNGTYYCVVVQREILQCPVCSKTIILKDDECYLEPIKTIIEEPPKKRKWFSRKEKTNEEH